MTVTFLVVKMDIRAIVQIISPSPSHDNKDASCYFVFDRKHDVEKEEHCVGNKGIEEIHQPILDWVTNMMRIYIS